MNAVPPLPPEHAERLTAAVYEAIAAYQRIAAAIETLGAHLLVIESLLRESRRAPEPDPGLGQARGERQP